MNNEHRSPWECFYAKEDKSNCKAGRKPKSDQEYFEILCLCILQAGLRWSLIRKNWEIYREGFYGFDINRLSNIQSSELIREPNVIKNIAKIEAIVYNAKKLQRINEEYGSFSNFLGSLEELSDNELLELLTEKFKHIGRYTAEYYLHSVGYCVEY